MLDGSSVSGVLFRAGAHHGAAIFQRSNASASSERNSQFRGDAADGFEESGAAVAGSSDVEHDQFVGAFGVVTRSKRDGIAGIAQLDEVDSLDDAFAVGIEARNDAVRQAHAPRLRKFCSTPAPEPPLFSE